jgi:hypothetical protein
MTDANDRIQLYTMEPPFGLGRDALVRLREQLLSPLPREEIDAVISRTLGGLDIFLKVSYSTTYRAEGEKDHRVEGSVVFCSRTESDGYITPAGETVYWAGKPPDFWDGWLALPKYTTDYETALSLKSHVLGFGRTVVLEEFESMVPEDDDMMQIRTTFPAEIRDAEGRTVGGPIVDRPAVAVLAAMLDYLLAFSAKAQPEP